MLVRSKNKRGKIRNITLGTTPSSEDRPIPSGIDLFKAFDLVLGKWAKLSCEHIGAPVEGPSIMTLERSVYLSGPVKGLMVVRAHRKVGGLLTERLSSEAVQPLSEEDAFTDLVNLYCGHFLATHWDPKSFKPFHSTPCNPFSWPKQNPKSACAMLVEKYPMEIRLWVEPDVSN